MAGTDAAERLLNLYIALSNARGRMTRGQIRASVAGYDRERPGDDEAAAKRRTAAFERMFERDKEDLRRLGVPLRTVVDAAHGDDIGYVIDSGMAAMPPLELTATERALLAVATEHWREASLRAEARQALTKVASATPRVDAVELHLAARSQGGSEAAPVLAQAIADGQAVRFTYSSAASGTAIRTVEPWRLVVRAGILYLVGHDRDRGEARTYRLSRISSAIAPVGERGAFEAPAEVPAFSLAAEVPERVARLGLRPESGHSLRRRGTAAGSEGPWDVLEVPYTDTDALAAEVLALGGAARVISPSELADAVTATARAALAVAGG